MNILYMTIFQYPVYIADRVNHAQVGSGDVPAFVKVGSSVGLIKRLPRLLV